MTMTERQVGAITVLSMAGKLTLDDAGQLKGKVSSLIGGGQKADCAQSRWSHLHRQLRFRGDGQLPYDRKPGEGRDQTGQPGQALSGSARHHQVEHGV